MTSLGTPNSRSATTFLLLGSGEIGKEIAIEAQRLGVEVIAVDRYENAPAMQVAHRSHVISMLDGDALKAIIDAEKPDFIVPEIEAISTETLLELEQAGYHVVPTANATHLTMNREGIRNLASHELKLKTSRFMFASTFDEYLTAVNEIGIPCVVKPIMSSSGKGQSIIREKHQIEAAWNFAQTGARGGANKIIIEEFISFDYEITLLTVRHVNGTIFCNPIGHVQVNGDYRESWQPHAMPDALLTEAKRMATIITDALGGYGVFGVEFFIKNDDVYFSEVSPRPHDTGLVTLISQDLSEFALHVRAILGLPIPTLRQHAAAASYAIIAEGHGKNIYVHHLDRALAQTDTHIRLFGKPEVQGERRIGVLLSVAETVAAAREKNKIAYHHLKVEVCE